MTKMAANNLGAHISFVGDSVEMKGGWRENEEIWNWRISLSLSLPFRSAFLLKSSKRWDYIAGHKIFRRMNASERLIKNFLPLLRLQISNVACTWIFPSWINTSERQNGSIIRGGNTSNFCSNYFYRANLAGNRNASRYRSRYLTNSLVPAEANLNIPPTWKFIRLFRRDRWEGGNNTAHACTHAVPTFQSRIMHSRQKLRSLFKISKRGRSKPQSIIKTWHKYPIITRFINFNERQHENSPKLGKSLEISYRSSIHFPRDWTRTIFPRKPVENRSRFDRI